MKYVLVKSFGVAKKIKVESECNFDLISVTPESQPVIVGHHHHLSSSVKESGQRGKGGLHVRVGDTLKMKCYVNSTFPSANVTWFVNGKMVRMFYDVLFEPQISV